MFCCVVRLPQTRQAACDLSAQTGCLSAPFLSRGGFVIHTLLYSPLLIHRPWCKNFHFRLNLYQSSFFSLIRLELYLQHQWGFICICVCVCICICIFPQPNAGSAPWTVASPGCSAGTTLGKCCCSSIGKICRPQRTNIFDHREQIF